MYFDNCYSLPVHKEPNKCNKIFRPWDFSEGIASSSVEIKYEDQDSTISTTTEEIPKNTEKCPPDVQTYGYETRYAETNNSKINDAETKRSETKYSVTNYAETKHHETRHLETEYSKIINRQKEFSHSEFSNNEATTKRERLIGDAPADKPNKSRSATSGIGFRKPERSAQIPAVKKQGGGAKAASAQAAREESLKSLQNLPGLQAYPATVEQYPLYPEMLHANLAQSLGLTPSDPLFLESIAQGYALEEYARVLSQEHQAKLLCSRKQRPKKYRCPHCEVGFSNNGQLKGHIRIHTGERPFKCDEKNCGKTFTRNEELTRHKRIHSGLRPFPCTHCGKRFGRKDHLKKHSRTHLQPRGLYAVPVMLPLESWTQTSGGYPFVPAMSMSMPMFGY